MRSLLTFGVAAWMVIIQLPACNSPGNNPISLTDVLCDSLFTDSLCDFRHISLGNNREEADIGDGPGVLENEIERIVERFALRASDSTYAECYYNFNNNRFTDAEINITTVSAAAARQIKNRMIRELSQRFGPAVHERGFSYWKGKSKRGYTTEVFLQMPDNLGNAVIQIIFRADVTESPRMA